MTQNAILVFRQTLSSRIILTLAGALVNAFIPNHKPDAFVLDLTPTKMGDHFVDFVFGGFCRWDGQHFLSISLYGYTNVEKFAFFPLYPYLMAHVGVWLLRPLDGLISEPYRCILAGYIISNITSAAAAVVVYRFWVRLTQSVSTAHYSVALCIIQPATVFFMSCYTESIYFCATIVGVYLLCEKTPRPWLATLSFSVASACRSNGFLNSGFLVHFWIYQIARWRYRGGDDRGYVVRKLLVLCSQIMIIVSPFFIFQIYGWVRYCNSQHLCELSDSLDCESEKKPFCTWKIPLVYSYVQTLWDNGFLKYWQIKKIPLFMLATPTIYWSYLSIKKVSYECGLKDVFALRAAKLNKPWAGNPMLIASALHLTFLVIFGIFFMNVEVITRLVWSSSPLIYIFSTQVLQTNFASQRRQFIILYSFLYLTAGLCFHCNFYPWT